MVIWTHTHEIQMNKKPPMKKVNEKKKPNKLLLNYDCSTAPDPAGFEEYSPSVGWWWW